MKRWKSGRLVATLVIAFSVSLILYGSMTDDKLVVFKLTPEPLELTNQEIPYIYCNVKATTEIIDQNGNVVGTEQSKFFSSYPSVQFDFTDVKSGKAQTNFKVTPKIKCAVDLPSIKKEEVNAFSKHDLPLSILPSDLELRIYSKDSTGKKFDSYNHKLTTKEITITNSDDYQLGTFTVNANNVLKYFPAGQYNSLQEFTISGTLNTKIASKNWKLNYVLFIPKDGITTYRTIYVDLVAPPEPFTCPAGQELQDGICVEISTPQNPPPPEFVLTGDLIKDFQNCIASSKVDSSCFLSTEFFGIYIGIIAFMMLIGAVMKKPVPLRQMMYGISPERY